jgi:hypothetical protein
VYVVLHIDMKRAAADLMLTSGNHELEHRVPFFALQSALDASVPEQKTVENDKAARS